MVIEQKQTHIAYRCPHCGTAVLGYIGDFALSADMLKLKCDCGHSEMTVTYTAEKKVRLTVPCLFCENPHHFVVSQELFFGREIFLLNCPYANMDICFIGQPEALQKELDRSAKELNQMYEEVGLTLPGREEEEAKAGEEAEEETKDPEDLLPDVAIYDIVRFLVKELQADGAIDCPCHGGDYDFEVLPGAIRVYCTECGAEYVFPANSVSAAQEFLQVDSITLKPKKD